MRSWKDAREAVGLGKDYQALWVELRGAIDGSMEVLKAYRK